jgi:thioredoxin
MTVAYCKNLTEFGSYMEQSKDKLVVIDFTATWCGPCRMIAPHFQKLADSNSDVIFIKVDVDDAADVAGKCGIQAMPTFKFYKNAAEVKSFSGADPAALTSLVAKLK